METGRTDTGKGASGDDDTGGADETHRDDVEDDAHDAGDRAWTSFCDRTLRERERFARDSFDRDFYSRGSRSARGSVERGERGYDDRGARDYDDRGNHDYFCYFSRGPRGYSDRDPRGFDDYDARDFDRGACDYGRVSRAQDRDYDRGGGRFLDRRRESHRPPKISFPTFNGESDPLTWLNKCDNYFRGHRVPEDEKVWMVSLHLDGTAVEWYYQMECDFDLVAWPRFVDFVNLRFGPPIRANSIAEIKALVRTGTVEDYLRRFLTLLVRCDDLATRTVIDLYTGCLG